MTTLEKLCSIGALLFVVMGGMPLSAGAQTSTLPPETRSAHLGMTNADIVRMLKAGLSAETIALAIQTADQTDFDTGPEALIGLKEQGAGDKVLNAMLESRGKRENLTSSDSAAQPGDAPGSGLQVQIQELEQRFRELKTKYQHESRELQDAQNASKLGRIGCNPGTILGSLNCFGADLKEGLVATHQNNLKLLDAEIQNVQSQLTALRMSPARSPSGAVLSVLGTAPQSPRPMEAAVLERASGAISKGTGEQSQTFPVKRDLTRDRLGELTVSKRGLQYREADRPGENFSAECNRLVELRYRRGLPGQPSQLSISYRNDPYIGGLRILSREKDKERQRDDLRRIHQAIADACGILIKD